MAQKNKGPGIQSAAGLIRYYDSEEETSFKVSPTAVLVFGLLIGVIVVAMKVFWTYSPAVTTPSTSKSRRAPLSGSPLFETRWATRLRVGSWPSCSMGNGSMVKRLSSTGSTVSRENALLAAATREPLKRTSIS